jgi:hypothetical protein
MTLFNASLNPTRRGIERMPWPRSTLRCAVLLLLAWTAGAAAESSLPSDFPWGDFDFKLRWRYEHVDDDLAPGGVPLKKADASTIRAVAGYRTGTFRGFSAYVQGEAVVVAGLADYFDGSGAGTQFATVVDPAGVELNEGYLAWESDRYGLRLRAGRQEITYRAAPFHRFVGNVLWRQNWQTFDAVSARAIPIRDLEAHYDYIWQVHRVFGYKAPEPISRWNSDSHLFTIQYRGFKWAAFETYAYLLDFSNSPRFSTDTFGIRADGSPALNDTWSALYALEYAHQTDADNNPADYAAYYLMAEGGFRVKLGEFLKSVTLKMSYEFFEGDGTPGGAFVSALGTNHPFQGWADRFLTTPDNGLADLYPTLILELPEGLKFLLNYHDFDSDAGSYDYGDELDVQLTWDFLKNYQIGAKAAFYDADPGPQNATGPLAADVTKFWIWGQASF